MSRVRLVAATISLALVASVTATVPSVAAIPAPADGGGADRFRVEVVSSAPDQVTGGDALVAVTLPDGVEVDDVRIERNGTDITDVFTLQEGPRILVGLVDELVEGRNTVTVESTARGKRPSPARLR